MRHELIDGRFRVGQVIGKGNMREVHRGEDLRAPEGSADRPVAVKTILRRRTGGLIDTGTDNKAVERFAREVRIMRRLEHPNLTRLIAGGISKYGGLPYLAMEFLDGETLRDLIEEERQLPVSWVAAIGAQIAYGLSAAHAADVVHRDLKPANVMLTRGGTVKVLDFGMGRIVDDPDEARLTSTGVSVGTARYMAPEQFEARLVTQAADLYTLGCVLYEMLVGVPPFVSESPFELARKHLETEPTPLGVIRGGIPSELIRLVGRLLAKDPADRPASAADVHDSLYPLAVGDGDTPRLPHWSALDPTRPLAAMAARALAAPSASAPRPAPVTLNYITREMARFAEDLGDSGRPFLRSDERREQIRAELDSLFFHLYGISRDDAAYILDAFPIVRRKDEAKYGTYRTKELILAEYDRMAAAGVSLENPLVDGENYRSTLTPPPGHGPRHPA
ncbi:serine/threonine-protein kinase [Streptomyces collinus]|uniref:serine/threonine-protein kinase n=1 Tax=Streptomyces collinus TaxID=42684 RepID=UPI00342FBE2B